MRNNGALETLEFPTLQSMSFGSIRDNASLQTLAMPALTEDPTLLINNNPSLTTCIGTFLAAIGDCPP